MGTIRAQQTDHATAADALAEQNKVDAAAATSVNELKDVVEENSNSTIELVLAVQRLEARVDLLEENDGGLGGLG